MKKYFRNRSLLFVGIFIIYLASSCKKQDEFLNVIPNNHFAIPNTLDDLGLMTNYDYAFNAHDPSIGVTSSDEYYVTLANWNRDDQVSKNAYLWAPDIYGTQMVPDWDLCYQSVYEANVILDALKNINVLPSQQVQANSIRGTALFYRAWAFYNLLEIFTMPYDSTKAASDLGIPLRLSSDLNIKSTRANEKDCYNQLINDLKEALELLPHTSARITLPTNTSAAGFLARVYLSMGDYANALKCSDKFLTSFNKLTDFNTLTPGSFPLSNTYLSEDAFHCNIASESYRVSSSFTSTIIDSVLYNSYDSNDLRKSCFFGNYGGSGPSFVGTFDITGFGWFTGITTGEMYLTRGECYARMNNKDSAIADLNTLLTKRYKAGTYIPYSPTTADDALKLILMERRKEMVFRGTRWADLRRLNKDPRFAITLKRNIAGITATLPPNDPRYALPIPFNEIKLSGIQQNPR